MRMDISLRDDEAVEARFHGHTIQTAQDGSKPAPFDLFLASLGTCTGYYVARFCRLRSIPTDGIRITQISERDPDTHMVGTVEIDIELPESFPDRYRDAVLRAAKQCAVKRHLAAPPVIIIKETAPAGA